MPIAEAKRFQMDDSEEPEDLYRHPTAIIEAGATIGGGSKVWHHVHIRAGASIGSNCTLGKNVFVDSGVLIGDSCKIQNNVSLYSGVVLESRVFVGPSAVFTNDLFPRAESKDWEVVSTLVKYGASIGANATLVCGNTIGSYAMVGAGSVVTHPVAAHSLVIGNPARLRGWVCVCGRLVSRSDEPPASLSCRDHLHKHGSAGI